MMNEITMSLQVDQLILSALKEDISSEDVTTNAVMKQARLIYSAKRMASLQDCLFLSGFSICWIPIPM